MDFTIVYCVTLTSYGKALYLHFYYLTIWTHCTCMYVLYIYILPEINNYYYYKCGAIQGFLIVGDLSFPDNHDCNRVGSDNKGDG